MIWILRFSYLVYALLCVCVMENWTNKSKIKMWIETRHEAWVFTYQSCAHFESLLSIFFQVSSFPVTLSNLLMALCGKKNCHCSAPLLSSVCILQEKTSCACRSSFFSFVKLLFCYYFLFSLLFCASSLIHRCCCFSPATHHKCVCVCFCMPYFLCVNQKLSTVFLQSDNCNGCSMETKSCIYVCLRERERKKRGKTNKIMCCLCCIIAFEVIFFSSSERCHHKKKNFISVIYVKDVPFFDKMLSPCFYLQINGYMTSLCSPQNGKWLESWIKI